jgi:hypothetical protein
MPSPNTPYQKGEMVGKSLAQVGRTPSQDITATDADVYEKWAQALGSANEQASSGSGGALGFSMLLPIVVIPNDRLWFVDFDASGNRVTLPTMADRISYFVSEQYQRRFRGNEYPYAVTHLEFVTQRGLNDLLLLLNSPRALHVYFHEVVLEQFLKVRNISW